MPDDAPASPNGRLSPAPPPSYRPARSGRGGLDAGTRILLIGAGGVLALLLLLVGGWAISGRHGDGAVPTIQADKQPWRVKPDNPGGMQVVGANDGGGDVPGQPSATAPGPEAPTPAALRAAQPVPPAATAPVVAVPEPSPPAPTSAPPAASAAVPPAAPQSATPSAATPSAATPLAATPLVAAPQAAAPARAPVQPAVPGGTFVQLAALGSEAGAHTEWQRLKGRMADVLTERQPVIQRVERDGRTLWRLRIGGFPSIADATRFCGRVHAKGGACELATF